MSRLVFDIEGHVPTGTKGDFAEATKEVFCIVTQDLDTGEMKGYDEHGGYGTVGCLDDGLHALSEAEMIIGHNVVRYDLPVLSQLLEWDFEGDIYDTLLASHLMWPGPKWMRLADVRFIRKNPTFPKQLMGRHSLEAWGHRLGVHKAGYDGGFESYNQEMFTYCGQDVRVNTALAKYLMDRPFPDDVVIADAHTTKVLRRQEMYGVAFDEKKAVEIMLDLTKQRDTLRETLCSIYPPVWKANGEAVHPKKAQESRKYKPGQEGYRNTAVGAPYVKIKLTEFNPGSGDQVADRLMRQGWKPGLTEYTPGGKPQVTEKILEDLDYPGIAELIKYDRCTKILGFISEGNNAWLKLVKNGRLHGQVTSTGTVTHRCAHKKPNTGQVPRVGSYLGQECRSLFCASDGRVLVGCDAAGLQLRALAHYLGRYDGGDFAEAVTSGDPHTYMMEGTGILVRDDQKTFTYAMLFSAWHRKLGMIKINSFRRMQERGEWDGTIPSNSEAIAVGEAARDGLAELLKMDQLDGALDKAWARRYVISLDGRHVPLLSRRQALNTLLMSAEAVIMKVALRLCDVALGGISLMDWEFVLNVHDEWQIECEKEDALEIGATMQWAIQQAGKDLGLRVRLDGEYKVGNTWAETH